MREREGVGEGGEGGRERKKRSKGSRPYKTVPPGFRAQHISGGTARHQVLLFKLSVMYVQ